MLLKYIARIIDYSIKQQRLLKKNNGYEGWWLVICAIKPCTDLLLVNFSLYFGKTEYLRYLAKMFKKDHENPWYILLNYQDYTSLHIHLINTGQSNLLQNCSEGLYPGVLKQQFCMRQKLESPNSMRNSLLNV